MTMGGGGLWWGCLTLSLGLSAFNQFIVQGNMRGEANYMLLYQDSLSLFELLCTLTV